jgi:TrmH family RNA methyltransferase
MGALFAVPVVRARGVDELPGRRVALVAGAGVPLDEIAVDGDVTLVVGAEREGLPDDVVAACDAVAHIPIGGGDSLNAAMAATVALYEIARRGRMAGPHA